MENRASPVMNVVIYGVLIATPVDLRRLINIRQPTCRVRYEFEEIGSKLRTIVTNLLAKRVAGSLTAEGRGAI